MTTLTRPDRIRCPGCQQLKYTGQFRALVVLDSDPRKMRSVEAKVCRACQARGVKIDEERDNG